MTSANDPAATYGYTYDGLGRVDVQTQSIVRLAPQVVFDSRYNSAGERTLLASKIGGYIDSLTISDYDEAGRLRKITQQSGNHAVAPKRVDFTYDALRRFDMIRQFAGWIRTSPP